MKQFYTLFAILSSVFTLAQQPYYNSIDFKKNGVELKTDLTELITSTHKNQLTYKEIWEAIKNTDVDPTNSSRIVQLYGYNKNSTGDDAYYNSVNNNGGGSGQWNREHTYAQSIGTPALGQSGPGADAHHLRAADVKRNNNRGNLKFADGTGTSKSTGGGWYPGDEWKGDVARMMMYMYVRYEKRCLPANIGFGSTTSTPDGMIDLFLKWNAEDPVSELEIQRNEYLGNLSNTYGQGNRNPFIDNPYLATMIWGGTPAENKWSSTLSTNDNYIANKNSIKTYTKDNSILIVANDNSITEIQVFNSFGQNVRIYHNTKKLKTIELKDFSRGVYYIKINGTNYSTNQKVMIK